MSHGRDYQSNWHAASRLCMCVSVTFVADPNFQAKLCDLSVRVGLSVIHSRLQLVDVYAKRLIHNQLQQGACVCVGVCVNLCVCMDLCGFMSYF